MTFIRKDFSPVGAQARAGVAPQKFSYITTDSLATVKANGYMPRDNTSTDKDGMLGVVSPNDIISVVHDAPPADLTTQTAAPDHSILRVAGDGRGSGISAVVQNTAGAGYSAGDRIKVTIATGTVLRNVILRANDATVSAPTIIDPGSFDSANLPTTLTNLATVTLEGGGDDALTVDITLTSNPEITVWEQDINDS